MRALEESKADRHAWPSLLYLTRQALYGRTSSLEIPQILLVLLMQLIMVLPAS